MTRLDDALIQYCYIDPLLDGDDMLLYHTESARRKAALAGVRITRRVADSSVSGPRWVRLRWYGK